MLGSVNKMDILSKTFEENKGEICDELINAGVCHEHANIIGDCFATADLYGVFTHGGAVLPNHLKRVKNGSYNLSPKFIVERETTAFAVIDGDNAIGPVSADYCMKYAVEKSKESGVFFVFSRNNNTFGPAFYYPLKAAEKGYIGIICSNSPAQMAPFGGKERLLGTNPFAAVIPVPGSDPIIIDMATSVVAKSKFKEYKEKGKKLPDGWALDESGKPTNDPDEGIRGFVLPMAGYKGYGIAMLIDILSGVISGAAYLNHVGRFYSEDKMGMNVGFCCIAINPSLVMGEEYTAIINEYVNCIRNSEKIDGQMISIPGDDRNVYKNRRVMEEL